MTVNGLLRPLAASSLHFVTVYSSAVGARGHAGPRLRSMKLLTAPDCPAHRWTALKGHFQAVARLGGIR